MGRGGYPTGGFGGGGKKPNNMMEQARRMQAEMDKVQEALAETTVEASAGGGAVTVVATGDKAIRQITIQPDVVDPEEVEMLQDLIMAAVNEALRKAGEMADGEMNRITGELPGGLPGL